MNWKEKIARLLIRFGYRVLKVEMIGESFRLVGINMRKSTDRASTIRMLETVIFENLTATELVLDVGANIGEFTELLLRHFKPSNTHSLEPNANCATLLREKLPNPIHSCALGSETGSASFFHYEDDPLSSHASLRKQSLVLEKPILREEVKVMRTSHFLTSNGLGTPSFVKIDTEGNDLDVIRGLGDFKRDVKFILFEFNDMYIYSGVFLRDFYFELTGFDLYRLSEKGLIDISSYSPYYEVFRYQNILAVNKKLKLNVSTTY